VSLICFCPVLWSLLFLTDLIFDCHFAGVQQSVIKNKKRDRLKSLLLAFRCQGNPFTALHCSRGQLQQNLGMCDWEDQPALIWAQVVPRHRPKHFAFFLFLILNISVSFKANFMKLPQDVYFMMISNIPDPHYCKVYRIGDRTFYIHVLPLGPLTPIKTTYFWYTVILTYYNVFPQ